MTVHRSTKFHKRSHLQDEALAAYQQRNWPKAVRLFERLAKLEPNDFAIRANLATSYYHNGDGPKAVPLFTQCMMEFPRDGDISFLLAETLRMSGKTLESIAQYERCLSLKPGFIDAYNNLTVVLLEAGRDAEAIQAADRHMRAAPADWRGHFNRGLALYRIGKISDSLEPYETALKLNHNSADLRNCYASSLFDLGRLDDAEKSWREALRIDPNHAAAHNNLALCALKEYRHADALAENTAALISEPNRADYWQNRGEIYRQIGHPERAIAAYDRALHCDPNHIEAFFGRGVTCLTVGRWFEGWYGYLGRRSVREMTTRIHRFPLPPNLKGKTVVIERDQGLGDELSFLRFVPMLKERGAKVIYLGDPRLTPLLQRATVPLADEYREWTAEPIEGADYRIAIGDLPYLLATEDVPPPFRIATSAAQVFRMRRQMEFGGFVAPFIGVTWRAGDPNEKGVLFKSIDPLELGRILRDIPGSLVIMQRNPTAEEIDRFETGAGRPAQDLSRFNNDIEDIFTIAGLLDEYVCVSNTNVHFRAAHGLPSRILAPTPPDFRWLARDATSCWFPNTAIYRQSADSGSWTEAWRNLADDLVVVA